jgi:hypothetical protein
MVPIIPGGPVWPELGSYSGNCYAAGCGYTGWVQANYVIPTAGSYYLKVGVVNWADQAFDSGLAVDGVTVGGVPVTASLPCTPVQSDSGLVCPDTSRTPPADIDPKQEGGQLGTTCNNGPTKGTIRGNVTVSAGQNCSYKNCEIMGSLTVNGGTASLDTCQVDDGITVIAGTLSFVNSSAESNVGISQASFFNVGPDAQIQGNLTIQKLGPNNSGTVCDTQVQGNVSVNNNMSTMPIQIGETTQTNCAGNVIQGNLSCAGNTKTPISGSNKVQGSVQGQCHG